MKGWMWVWTFSGSASSRVGPGVDGFAGAKLANGIGGVPVPTLAYGLPLLGPQQQHKQFRVSNAERIGHSEQLRFSLCGGVLRRKRDGGELLGGIHGSGLLFDGVGADYGDGGADCERDRIDGGRERDKFHGRLERRRDRDAERDDRRQDQRRQRANIVFGELHGLGQPDCGVRNNRQSAASCWRPVHADDAGSGSGQRDQRDHHRFIDSERGRGKPLQQRVGGDECGGDSRREPARPDRRAAMAKLQREPRRWENTVDTSYTYALKTPLTEVSTALRFTRAEATQTSTPAMAAKTVCVNCAANSGTAECWYKTGRRPSRRC